MDLNPYLDLVVEGHMVLNQFWVVGVECSQVGGCGSVARYGKSAKKNKILAQIGLMHAPLKVLVLSTHSIACVGFTRRLLSKPHIEVMLDVSPRHPGFVSRLSGCVRLRPRSRCTNRASFVLPLLFEKVFF